MSGVDSEDESKGSWQDVIILLLGDLRAGNTASQVLTDILEERDLPDCFHQLCTKFLVAKEWTARTNAGVTIKSLCTKFATVLTPLITLSKSDGELLILSELDISAVTNCKDAELLSGDSSVDNINEGSELYSKSWLKKQRKALRKRLGLETFTEDATIAVDYITSDMFIQDHDLTAGRIIIPVDDITSSENENNIIDYEGKNQQGLQSEPNAAVGSDSTSQESDNVGSSAETWLAR